MFSVGVLLVLPPAFTFVLIFMMLPPALYQSKPRANACREGGAVGACQELLKTLCLAALLQVAGDRASRRQKPFGYPFR
jgi:hypothetical protein